MTIKVLDCLFTVCQITDLSGISAMRPPFFLAKTDDEISLVCATDDTPSSTLAREDHWRALRVEGVLDFALVGILAKISTALAEAGIPIFAASTYQTDYILVKADRLDAAVTALRSQGYAIAS